jgi:hypothetical protein
VSHEKTIVFLPGTAFMVLSASGRVGKEINLYLKFLAPKSTAHRYGTISGFTGHVVLTKNLTVDSSLLLEPHVNITSFSTPANTYNI